MTEPFNKLTPAEAERLAMLAEEAGEIVQIVGKILRHGYESFHPKDMTRTPNRELLAKELGDLEAVHDLMELAGDVTDLTSLDLKQLRDKKLRYAHHQ